MRSSDLLAFLGACLAGCSSGQDATDTNASVDSCTSYRYKLANPALAVDIGMYGLDPGEIVADSAGIWDADGGVVRIFHEARALASSAAQDADGRRFGGIYAAYSPTGRDLALTRRNIFSGRPSSETEPPGHPKVLDTGATSRIYFREQNRQILSATTTDWGRTWTRDPGVRLSLSAINAAFGAAAGSTRYMDSDWSGLSVGGVYRYLDSSGTTYYRMYLSNNDSAGSGDSDIFSAISTNGVDFALEPGVRLGDSASQSGTADDALRPAVLQREPAGCLTLFYQVQRCDGGAQCLKYASSADHGLTFGPTFELGDGARTVTAGVKGVGGISGPSVATGSTTTGWLMYTDSASGETGAYITVWDLVVAK